MASTSSVPVPTVNVSHGEKPEKFNGTNFKRWQQKMLFYLTTLSLAKFLREDPPELVEGVPLWNHGKIQISYVEIIF